MPRSAKTSTPEDVVTIDRRRKGDRRQSDAAVAEKPRTQPERRKKTPRRRQIDPTTCERDYTDEEVEFMRALDEYKRKSGRMFPTCSELLEVVKSLGYSKAGAPTPIGELSEYVGDSPAADEDEDELLDDA